MPDLRPGQAHLPHHPIDPLAIHPVAFSPQQNVNAVIAVSHSRGREKIHYANVETRMGEIEKQVEMLNTLREIWNAKRKACLAAPEPYVSVRVTARTNLIA